MSLLFLFVVVSLFVYVLELYLDRLNLVYFSDKKNQHRAKSLLSISDEEMQKSYEYALDRYKFSQVSDLIKFVASLSFLGYGGLGWAEGMAKQWATHLWDSPILVGILFFGVLAALSLVLSLPFSLYHTFVIEQKHGFNKQTPLGFMTDLIKGLCLALIFGSALGSGVLWIMQNMGDTWWIWAWIALSFFSLLTAWLFPTLLAPLFNKFTPVDDLELKRKIEKLAEDVGFRSNGIFVMDASKRSEHGNAYFTGVFGKKRIVLFDTLVKSMSADQIVAVLAHELGHFKLHHVRHQLILNTLMSGVMFYFISYCLPMEQFYQAFGLQSVSNHGALVVFSLWFGLIDFLVQPLFNHLSRRNEFAADQFAKIHTKLSNELGAALLKLREKSKSMPLCHPLYSLYYHSHPPMIERLTALGIISERGK